MLFIDLLAWSRMNETTTYDVGTPHPGLEQDERDDDI
jgi:hypothetical protein